MKARDFGMVLTNYAEILSVAGGNAEKESVAALADFFVNNDEATVANVLKRLSSIPVVSGSQSSPSLGDVAGLISPLEGLLRVAAKAGVTTDAQSVLAFLRGRPSEDLRSFLLEASEHAATRDKGPQRKSGIREELVRQYQQELEASLASQEGFSAVFKMLASTNSLSSAEIRVLSKQFTGVSSPSKARALKKIWSRHQSLMTHQAKAKATGGRSAA